MENNRSLEQFSYSRVVTARGYNTIGSFSGAGSNLISDSNFFLFWNFFFYYWNLKKQNTTKALYVIQVVSRNMILRFIPSINWHFAPGTKSS